MESAQIQFSGLASGLDSRAIIDAILDVERIPILRAENRKTQLKQQKSIFDDLKTKLNTLLEKVREIDTAGELKSFKATSSKSDAVGVSASGTASEGSYTLEVMALAKARTEASSVISDNTAAIGAGDIDITVDGTTTRVSVAAGDTIQDLADSINDSDSGVIATVINDGTGYRLTVTAEETGATGFTLDDSSFTGIGIDLTDEIVEAGNDASFEVNGLAVTRSSNTIDDLVTGVTFNLLETGQTSTITVSADTDAMKEKIEGFVEAYNDVMSLVNNQSTLDDDGNPTGSLFGDSSVRSIGSTLRTTLQSVVSGTGSSYTSLASLGIRTNSSGSLAIDTSDLEEALGNDLEGVAALFADSSSGVAQSFVTTIENLTDSSTGIIKIRQDSIDSRSKSQDRSIERLEQRLTRLEERLVQQYAALETLVSKYQSQGAALGGALGGGQ